MIAAAKASNDMLTLVRVVHNAGYSYYRIRELDKATTYQARALALWDQLGCDSESARSLWLLALVDFARGDWQKAADGLIAVRRQFAALGLKTDEALVRLELAELLILLGRAAEVPQLLEGIAVRFATEGMTRKAKVALACVSLQYVLQKLSSCFANASIDEQGTVAPCRFGSVVRVHGLGKTMSSESPTVRSSRRITGQTPPRGLPTSRSSPRRTAIAVVSLWPTGDRLSCG